ncbi:MAG: tetratricopeptide repeat protein [Bacteroidia bacterium]|nr:MAG: tetratricopeptide repeat protein [Bacteroidia bacterium]
MTSDQVFIRRLTEIILENLGNENFGVKELAQESGLSRYSLGRKLHSICKKTVNKFIREVRLQRSLEMLQNESLTASEVAYQVGFHSPTYFNKCFREFYGFPPGKVKEGAYKSPDTYFPSPISGKQEPQRPTRRVNVRIISGLLFLILVTIIVVFSYYPEFFKGNTLEKLRSSEARMSIAIMPFQNMTHDTIWNIWQEGIQGCLISSLSNAPELIVRQKETITALLQAKGLSELASISPDLVGTISKKLDASIFICGSIIESGSTLRVDAQLTDTQTKEVYKSFQIEGTLKEEGPLKDDIILSMIDSLSAEVKSFLVISKLKKDISKDHPTEPTTISPEAYRYFIYGNKAFSKLDWPLARTWYSQALAIDSNFFDAAIQLSAAYANPGMVEQSVQWVLWLYNKRNLMPVVTKIWTNWVYAINFESPSEQIKYLRQLLDIDDQSPDVYFLIGQTYNSLNQYDKAIPELEKSLEIFHKWDSKPFWVVNYFQLGLAYYKTGKYKKEKKLYRKAEKDFPDDPPVLMRQAILALSHGHTREASGYLNKFISISKEYSSSETDILESLAYVYTEAGIPDKAEECYRKALSLEPEKPDRMNHLALFLIDQDRNVIEGLRLVDRALELSPDNFEYLDTKGWGLYKQGNYKEALELLERSWDLKPAFIFDLYLHLEEVKKATGNR